MTKKRIPKWANPRAARLPRLAVRESLKDYVFDEVPSTRVLAAENTRLGNQIDADHKRRAEELGKNL